MVQHDLLRDEAAAGTRRATHDWQDEVGSVALDKRQREDRKEHEEVHEGGGHRDGDEA